MEIVMVLIQTDYTASRVGTILKFVRCEKCSTEFEYMMIREATGHGTTLYNFDEEGAADRANRRADANLRSALSKEIEPVECPKCGCFQTDMVAEARRRYLKYLGWRFAVIGFVLLVPFFFCGSVYLNGMLAAVPRTSIYYATLALAALILFLPVVRSFLALGYDPNRDTPEQRAARGYGRGTVRADPESILAETEKATRVPTSRVPTSRVREPGTDVVFMDIPLAQLLGKGINSLEMEAFRTAIADDPAEDQFDAKIAYHSWAGHGLVFEFHNGKLVFIFLCAEGFEGCDEYRGELPLGLSFTDTRADVERKLGKPDIVDNVEGILPVFARYTSKGIKVGFTSKDLNDMSNRIESVGIFPAGPSREKKN
jgi:hypothetical protein